MAIDKQTAEILDGLTGDVQLGKKYYIFTVTFHYIGRIQKITPGAYILEPADGLIVMNAGSENDAVSQIVAGTKQPEIKECPGVAIQVMRQAITAILPMKK